MIGRGRAFASALRRTADRRLNPLKRRLRVGHYWEWLPEGEIPREIDIMSMLFPLRYDVMLRKGFFDFYEANRGEGVAPAELVSAARELDYHGWFRHVFIPRNVPSLVGDDAAIEHLFERRVAENISLHESLRKSGFDETQPIVPYTAIIMLPSTSGRTALGNFHAGDGCHRIAALLALGHKSVPREYVRPKRYSRLVPLDNTALMAEAVPVPKEWLKGL